MITPRVMPCLLLKGEGLVKTVKFENPKYLGDPRNIMKIFNEKEVDEIIILDIYATLEGRKPKFELIREIVSEAFMPVAYGGGLKEIEDIKQLMNIGIEKVVISSYAIENPSFIKEAVNFFGSQSIVVCLDVKRNIIGKTSVFIYGGRKKVNKKPEDLAKIMQDMGAGEIIINSIDRDGTMQGYDIDLVRSVALAVKVPVVACGGAGGERDVLSVVNEGGASAAAAGSMFVFQGKHKAVLISYPGQEELKMLFQNGGK